jgi:hypothetical protein
MTVQELFQKISERPAMYLGEATLTRFDAFLLGWMLESGDPNTSVVMSGFQAWVSDRYKIKSSHSWANIIRFYAQDDVSALKDAFTLFNEYLETMEATTTTP